GILWNGDLITCCMDWRRARVLGNAREDSLYNLWNGTRYQTLRDLSDAGRLNELPLCRECGQNRFSIDTEALRGLLAQQTEEDPVHRSDLEIVAMLEAIREETPDLIQFDLLRKRRNTA